MAVASPGFGPIFGFLAGNGPVFGIGGFEPPQPTNYLNLIKLFPDAVCVIGVRRALSCHRVAHQLDYSFFSAVPDIARIGRLRVAKCDPVRGTNRISESRLTTAHKHRRLRWYPASHAGNRGSKPLGGANDFRDFDLRSRPRT